MKNDVNIWLGYAVRVIIGLDDNCLLCLKNGKPLQYNHKRQAYCINKTKNTCSYDIFDININIMKSEEIHSIHKWLWQNRLNEFKHHKNSLCQNDVAKQQTKNSYYSSLKKFQKHQGTYKYIQFFLAIYFRNYYSEAVYSCQHVQMYMHMHKTYSNSIFKKGNLKKHQFSNTGSFENFQNFNNSFL